MTGRTHMSDMTRHARMYRLLLCCTFVQNYVVIPSLSFTYTLHGAPVHLNCQKVPQCAHEERKRKKESVLESHGCTAAPLVPLAARAAHVGACWCERTGISAACINQNYCRPGWKRSFGTGQRAHQSKLLPRWLENVVTIHPLDIRKGEGLYVRPVGHSKTREAMCWTFKKAKCYMLEMNHSHCLLQIYRALLQVVRTPHFFVSRQ